ncbi:hypothetical protein DM02DRAFT_708508 [Periconia macrospinosa]|uniref:Uncharacterized protein n=1 Tax=Periconia macrospinosa TaxID=97972 RepID=A0A2V1DRB3_9PLEO|nr:hypothetical protein DM02DRAFT_708508 [Periconia macrospinosa]
MPPIQRLWHSQGYSLLKVVLCKPRKMTRYSRSYTRFNRLSAATNLVDLWRRIEHEIDAIVVFGSSAAYLAVSRYSRSEDYFESLDDVRNDNDEDDITLVEAEAPSLSAPYALWENDESLVLSYGGLDDKMVDVIKKLPITESYRLTEIVQSDTMYHAHALIADLHGNSRPQELPGTRRSIFTVSLFACWFRVRKKSDLAVTSSSES